jgi:hypothetical protein
MRRFRNSSRRTVAAWSGLIALLAIGALADPGLALTMAPALLMLALFATGIRPGERLMIRVLERGGGRAPRATSSPRPRLALVVRASGVDLASALAMRPPPAASLPR